MHYSNVCARTLSAGAPGFVSSLLLTTVFVSFSPAQSLSSNFYPTTGFPNGVALGDFDRDGNCDAVAVHQSSTTPSVMTLMRGDGAGALLPPASFACSGTGGAGIVTGDWNGDSLLDVVTVELVNNASPFGRVSLFAGNGLGGFQTSVAFVVGAGSRSIAAADFNLDGKLDLVTANSALTANSMTVLLGDGLGGFTTISDFGAGSKPWAVATGDLNQDGAPDVTLANNGSNNISVLTGDGLGSFPGGAVNYATGVGPRGITVGNLNGDGSEDVVSSNGSSNDVSVYKNNGAGVLTLTGNFLVGTNPSSVTIGDINGDGFADICATDQTGMISNMESILLGNGTLGYSAPNNFPTGNFPSSSRVGDMNSDGRADIVVSNYGGNGMTVLLNTATPPLSFGNFGAGTEGCFGNIGLTINSTPQTGNAQFRMNMTNAPRSTLGLLMIADAADGLGSDPFSLGATLYVDLFAATEILALDAWTDISGGSSNLAPIPDDSLLIGKSYFAQGLFLENVGASCSASWMHVSTSVGLGLTILQ